MNRKLKSSLSMFLSAAIITTGLPVVASAETGYAVQATDVVSVGKAAFDYSEKMTAINLAAAPAAPAVSESFIMEPLVKLTLPSEGVGPFVSGDTTISISGDGVLTVSGNGAMADLADGNACASSEWASYVDSISEIVIEDGVTTVGAFCFNGFTSVTKVTIGADVTAIGADSFAGCTALKTLTINSEKLESFGDRAFRDCAPITSLTIPTTVTSIGEEAFLGCKYITKVTIPGGVGANLGAGAFYGCTSITEVVIGEGVTMIKENTFSDCSSLTTLDLPEESLKTIGASAFNTCSALSVIDGSDEVFEVPESVEAIGETAFNGCKSIKGLIIAGDNLTDIGESAFKTCEALESINITGGNGLVIGASAFAGTKALIGVTMGEGNVTKLSDEVFMDSGIQNISLPNTLTTIGKKAFMNSRLISITIPASTVTVDENAFAECAALTTIKVIDDNRTTDLTINKNACLNCTALTTLDLSGTKYLGNTAFSGCSALKSLTLPESITTMGSSVFNNCTSLSSVTIEEGAKAIGVTAFAGCSSLKSITIPSTITTSTKAFQNNAYIESVTVKCPTIGTYMFDSCSALTSITLIDTVTIGTTAFKNGVFTSITLPDTLTTINASVFEGCSNLTSLAIPDGVTVLGKAMLKNATSLKSVTFNKVKTINANAFENCFSLEKVELPDTVTSLGVEAFTCCTSLQNVIIPDTVTTIGSGLFSGCTSFTEMTIPEGFLEVPNNIFDGCTSLHTVNISSEATEILDYAFNNCVALKNFSIPSTVTVIGKYAFTNCGLIDTTIPSAVTEIGEYAFSGCSSLGKECTVALPTSAEYVTIDKGTFKNCTSLASPSIPANVTIIKDEAFYNCSSSDFTRIDITGNVGSIGKNAFALCSNLSIVNITSSSGSGCKTIGDNAFDGCTKLRSVPLPSTLTGIGKSAFNNCQSLANVTVPTNVTTIGDSAFSGCSSLAKISIGSTQITKIPASLFNGCSALESIEMPSTVTEIGASAFNGCSSLGEVTIPVNVTKINNMAFMDCTSLEYIVIPAAVKTFGTSMFSGCTKLENAIVLPTTYGPTSVASKMFENCSPKLTIYCYEGAKIITYANAAKISYQLIESSDGTYVVFLKQPKNVCGADIGDTAEFSVKVASEGKLTYKWYYKNPGDADFTLAESFTGSTYSVTVSEETDGQQVYCMATSTTDDSTTNTVSSNVAYVSTLKAPAATVASKAPTAISIKWSAIDSATGYEVYRADSLTADLGDPVATLDSTATTYTDTDVVIDATYYYYVVAVNSELGVKSELSEAIEVTVPSSIDTVKNLKAIPGDSKVTLTWDAIGGATNYSVLMKKGTSWITLGSTGTKTTFTATGLVNGGKYFFVVKAYASGMWSEDSEIVYAIPVSTVPQNVAATAGDSKVTISWDAVSGATNYAVLMKNGTSWTTLGSAGTKTSYTATGLTNGAEYTFAIKAYANGAWSGQSAEVSATPTSTAPQNVKATAGDCKITISWDAVDGATNYAVLIKNGTSWTTLAATGTNTSYTATDLVNGDTYTFAVKAYANGAWSTASEAISATPVNTTPQNVKATAGDSKVTLTWDEVEGATNYSVLMRKGTSWITIGASGANSNYTARGLVNGGKYFFMVKAYVNGAWSAASEIVSASPVNSVPQNVSAVGGDGSVTLTWDAVSNATNYAVLMKKGTSWITLGATGTKTTYTATGLVNGGKYFFVVKAYANGAWSSESEIVSGFPTA